MTSFGAFVRAADPRFVTAAGWREAHGAGMRTIVDLRNDEEIRPTVGQNPTELAGSARFTPDANGPTAPHGFTRREVPLDDIEDIAFWRDLNERELNGTPLYYRPFLARKAHRCAAAIIALATAPPGGVLFHCGAGRDRTGLIALLLLALADVEPEAIAADYDMSSEHTQALFTAMGQPDQAPYLAALMARRHTTNRAAILELLHDFDAHDYLRTVGVSDHHLDTLRRRLLAPGPHQRSL
jgi:hypothetical protein